MDECHRAPPWDTAALDPSDWVDREALYRTGLRQGVPLTGTEEEVTAETDYLRTKELIDGVGVWGEGLARRRSHRRVAPR